MNKRGTYTATKIIILFKIRLHTDHVYYEDRRSVETMQDRVQ